jgi:NAD(P)-dependent dehydrogenase (short-subunit alcohol dehydrogenase family)
LRPKADHGERTYKGSGRLAGRKAIVTGGDSGIGRAVAIAFAREGADVVISYLSEEQDAKETVKWVERAGRKAVAVAGDIGDEAHRRASARRQAAGVAPARRRRARANRAGRHRTPAGCPRGNRGAADRDRRRPASRAS